MKLKIMIVGVLCISLLGLCIKYGNKIVSHPTDTTVSIEPEELIFLEELDLPNFTSTGFTYDPVNGSYWIGDHGSETTDQIQLIQINSDMTSIISCVQLEGYYNDGTNNLQGVTYDPIDNTLWCALGESIVEVTKEGDIVKKYTNDAFQECKANGISMDSDDSSIWVLW